MGTLAVNQDLVDQFKVLMAAILPPYAVALHRGFDHHFWICCGLMLLHIPGALVSLLTSMMTQVYAQIPAMLYAAWVCCKTEATV
jgi:uncharacterized membrane protein YqaE (UPF0057 family)